MLDCRQTARSFGTFAPLFDGGIFHGVTSGFNLVEIHILKLFLFLLLDVGSNDIGISDRFRVPLTINLAETVFSKRIGL
jgi:hypothetical protein